MGRPEVEKREALGVTILFWEFDDAPEEYRAPSHHCGDEDWVFFIPTGAKTPWWLETCGRNGDGRDYLQPFGWAESYAVDGGTVLIFAHA